MPNIDAKSTVRSRNKRPSIPVDKEVLDELVESGEMDLAPEEPSTTPAANSQPSAESATQDVANTLATRVREPMNQAMGYVQERGLDIDRMVRARPWNFVIGSAIAGFLYGYSRRR